MLLNLDARSCCNKSRRRSYTDRCLFAAVVLLWRKRQGCIEAKAGGYWPSMSDHQKIQIPSCIAFGFHGNSNTTIADAPLYDKSSHFSVSYGVISWLDAGVPPCKLVMGIPLYGRSWFLNSERTVVAYDNQSGAEYFYNGDLWVSFDGANVVQKKLQFAASSQLLGYFLWIISFDDSNSTISKQASESWHQYVQGGLGTMHAGAPNQYAAFSSSSLSLSSCIAKTVSCLLASVLLFIVLFHYECK